MAFISQIRLHGTSSAGPFEGRLSLQDGFQVISAPNGFGKSLAVTTLAWCLNLETTYGVNNGDNKFFPGAIQSELELNGTLAKVVSLVAEVGIETTPGSSLTLIRPVTGGDSRYIYFRLVTNKGAEPLSGKLQTGYGSLSDTGVGFQRFLFQKLNIPITPLLNREGHEVRLYLENLASLFFIEQYRGWADIQSRQVQRYGIEEVNPASFELLLGLDLRLRNRFGRQRHSAKVQESKIQLGAIIQRFNELLTANAWTETLSHTGSLENLVKRFGAFSFTNYLKLHFHYDFSTEQGLLERKRQEIQRLINEGAISEENKSHYYEISTKLRQLREIKAKRESELTELRIQRAAYIDALQALEAKRSSAKDLVRLKTDAIGFQTTVRCPTCDRELSPETFDLSIQTENEVTTHIDCLDKEVALIQKCIKDLDKDLKKTLIMDQKTHEEITALLRTLNSISSVIGSAREAIVKLSSELMEAERKLEKNSSLYKRVLDLQQELDAWATTASSLGCSTSPAENQETERLDKFMGKFREYLVALEHEGLSSRDVREVHLDVNYLPILGHRPLSMLGSASDRARMIMAYVTALVNQATLDNGHHPGFVVLDEPLQQNPDAKHREHALQMLIKHGNAIKGQVLTFTNLKEEELHYLSQGNVPFWYPSSSVVTGGPLEYFSGCARQRARL
jgi:hypothetical protein